MGVGSSFGGDDRSALRRLGSGSGTGSGAAPNNPHPCLVSFSGGGGCCALEGEDSRLLNDAPGASGSGSGAAPPKRPPQRDSGFVASAAAAGGAEGLDDVENSDPIALGSGSGEAKSEPMVLVCGSGEDAENIELTVLGSGSGAENIRSKQQWKLPQQNRGSAH